MEGKNTPPNNNNKKQKPTESTQQGGAASTREPPLCRTACLPLLLSLLFILEMEIHWLFFFLQGSFGCCILISGHSNS